ncbi:hypothetical protein E2562_002076 [Oryza meyeriana var. granulata]|uniref:Uncharacterized protein n=1 Tax=Oryza meyeriana var. granulata TaxID=110450 RepID=A0A6G1EE12_9ORYZ|nr:hypothetical protein E2562_002076 [Oryza meyeriana var. granulata]
MAAGRVRGGCSIRGPAPETRQKNPHPHPTPIRATGEVEGSPRAPRRDPGRKIPGTPGTHAGPRAGKVPGHARWSPGELDALNRVAAVAARLGRRCTLPALLGFDHVYADLLAVASPSEATALVRKLDRLAAAMAALYAELEALADLEQSARKLPTDEARSAL